MSRREGQRVPAVLLAAGRSRRMGAFKPLLPFGRQTVVEACVDNLLKAGVDVVVTVTGHRAGEMHQALNHLWPVWLVQNPKAESEMAESVACGVAALPAEAEAVLIALVDQPAIPPEVIREVLDARRERGARLVVPTWQGRGGHPVLVDLAFRDELLRPDPRRGLRALFEAHAAEVLRLPVGSPYVVLDMDTWEDYTALHREVFGRAPRLHRGD